MGNKLNSRDPIKKNNGTLENAIKGRTPITSGFHNFEVKFQKFFRKFSPKLFNEKENNYSYFYELKNDMKSMLNEIEEEFINSINSKYREEIKEVIHKSLVKYLKDTLHIMQVISIIENNPEIDTKTKESIKEIFHLSYEKASLNILSFIKEYKELEEKDVMEICKEGIERYYKYYFDNEKEKDKLYEFLNNKSIKEAIEDIKGSLMLMIANTSSRIPLIYTEGSFKLYFSLISVFAYNLKKEKKLSNKDINDILKELRSPEVMFFPSITGVYGAFSYLNHNSGLYKKNGREKFESHGLFDKLVKMFFYLGKPLEHTIFNKSSEFMASQVMAEIITEIEKKKGVKQGTIESIEKGKIISPDLLFRVMEKLKVSPDSSVSGPLDNLEFPEKLRTFHLGISSTIVSEGDIPIQKHIDEIKNIMTEKNVVFYPLEEAPAATDGKSLFVYPLISYSNLLIMNLLFFEKFLIHEKNHIELNTFKLDEKVIGGKRKILEESKIISRIRETLKENNTAYTDKNNLILLKFLQESLEKFNESVIKEFDRVSNSKRGVTFNEIYKHLYDAMYDAIKNNQEYYKNKKIKIFYRAFKEMGFSLLNIFEDRRIDHYYEENEGDTEKASLYKIMKYLLMYSSISSHKAYFKNKITDALKDEKEINDDEKDKITQNIIPKISLALYFTKLGEVFEEFYELKGEDNSVDIYLKLLKDITNELDKEAKKPIYMLSSNISIELSIIYFSIMVMFGDIGEPEQRTIGKNKSKNGGEYKNRREYKNRGSGVKIKDPWEDEEENDSEIRKDDKFHKKAKVERRDNYEGSIEENKGNEFILTIPKENVENYESFFIQISIGVVEEFTTHGKIGTELDTSKLEEFIDRGEQEIFKIRDVMVKKNKGPLYPKDINIYVSVDTSGSMHGERIEKSLQQIMAMFAAYKKVNEKKQYSRIRINLKLVSMSDDKVVGVWDANEFEFEDRGNSIVAKFNFHKEMGGTDLPAMIRAFKKVIEIQKDMVDRDIIIGNPKEYASYLILSFTDFGDNARDKEGFEKSIKSFEEFANQYYKESQSVRGEGERAGVALVFIAPEVDDIEIRKTADNLLKYGVAVLNELRKPERDIPALLSKHIDILRGEEPFNSAKKEAEEG